MLSDPGDIGMSAAATSPGVQVGRPTGERANDVQAPPVIAVRSTDNSLCDKLPGRLDA